VWAAQVKAEHNSEHGAFKAILLGGAPPPADD
jgi:hypothetical protein